MIGIVVPAHDEEAMIGGCLAALAACAQDPALAGEPVLIVVVLDRCTDRTGDIARSMGAACITLSTGNVGAARGAGFDAAIAAGARWIASTDADTLVPADWLSAQLAHGGDAFCGIVRVADWTEYGDDMRDEFVRTECRLDDHPHVHGANLGMTPAAYRLAGGFAAMAAHEDVALVRALVASGARIARKLDPAVTTSARRDARATGGFSDYLKAMEARLREPALAALATALVVPAIGGLPP